MLSLIHPPKKNYNLKHFTLKLRILDNKVRIRISQDELNDLSEGTAISSNTQFPSQVLKVFVVPTSSNFIKLDFVKNIIHIDIPIKQIEALQNSDQVGINHKEDINSKSLFLVFEKDFKCLTPRDEDESKLFKNPRESH